MAGRQGLGLQIQGWIVVDSSLGKGVYFKRMTLCRFDKNGKVKVPTKGRPSDQEFLDRELQRLGQERKELMRQIRLVDAQIEILRRVS